MIVLQQNIEIGPNAREDIELRLSRCWKEKVIIIPFGHSLVDIKEDKKLEE